MNDMTIRDTLCVSGLAPLVGGLGRECLARSD
jgi:hypothetical protein